MIPDIALPRLAVLDSEMAYREAGSSDAPVALTGNWSRGVLAEFRDESAKSLSQKVGCG